MKLPPALRTLITFVADLYVRSAAGSFIIFSPHVKFRPATAIILFPQRHTFPGKHSASELPFTECGSHGQNWKILNLKFVSTTQNFFLLCAQLLNPKRINCSYLRSVYLIWISLRHSNPIYQILLYCNKKSYGKVPRCKVCLCGWFSKCIFQYGDATKSFSTEGFITKWFLVKLDLAKQ